MDFIMYIIERLSIEEKCIMFFFQNNLVMRKTCYNIRENIPLDQ